MLTATDALPESWQALKQGRPGSDRRYVLFRRFLAGQTYQWFCGDGKPAVATMGMVPNEAFVFHSKGEMQAKLQELNGLQGVVS